MKRRPLVTAEQILAQHEELERLYPPGHTGRGEQLELVHALWLRHADALRQMRAIPSDRAIKDFALLCAMAVLSHKTGERNHRNLAREILGKTELTGGVERLARAYGKRLREEPGFVEDINGD